MANQVEGLNGTRSTYVYENIEIVEIDGVRMVRRLKDKKIIGLNSPKKEMQEGYYQRQFNKNQPRYQDLALKEELTNFFKDTGMSIGEFIKDSNIINYHLVWSFVNGKNRITLDAINEIKRRIDAYGKH
jgi:hypothetical protein